MVAISKYSPLFHITLLIINLFLFFSYLQVPMGSRTFIQKFFYLTNWNEILIIFYYLSAIFKDIKSYISNVHKTFSLNMILYRSIIPFSLLVSISYWVMLYFNPALLSGKKIGLKVPFYLDFWMHLGNSFLFALEILIDKEKKRNFKSSTISFFVTTSITVIYILALLAHFFIYGRHVYPFLKLLGWPKFALACLIIVILINFIRFGLEKIVDCLKIEKEHEA